MIDIDGKQIGYDSIYLPDKLYKAPIAQMGAPSIISLKKINEVRYSIVLEAQRIAPLVWLDLKPPFVGWFSDNAFTMTQNHRVIFIDIRPEFSQSRSTLELSDITVCSLRNCGDADR
ncbi:hypothetical protein AB6A40_010660 [Gnathostoma spinigerum]|uniref:Beta-mannosidase Ig-fold domain-containing protein n=1 Tax=Gnathostoma spinigerum TaxID=75299 RepID=A0ABD6F1J8_9BILA